MKKSLLAFLVSLALLPLSALSAQQQAEVSRTEDVIYGRKDGMALTLDVLQPAKPNGIAVFFVVNFGFVSSHSDVDKFSFLYKPILDHGYTVFTVVTGSQPRYVASEMDADVQRAVRFVRHNAQMWKVNPERFGITGASSGASLALLTGTSGGPGDPGAKDPVDRESSAVQAVAALMPPTDYLNWSKHDELWMEFESMRQYSPAFGPKKQTRKERQNFGKKISPIYFMTSKMPPTLLIHGDADKVVPLYQSQSFEKKCAEIRATCKLIVKPGAGHGPDFGDLSQAMQPFSGWFDQYLLDAPTR